MPETTNNELNLLPSDVETFARLTIPPGLLALAGIRRVSDAEARTDFGIVYDGDCSGVIFPYQRNGHRVTARLRRDHPELVKGKPKGKYLAPKNDVRHAYFVPGSDARLADPAVPVVIAEAEKSALAMEAVVMRTGIRLLPMAVSGAWAWKTTRGNKLKPDGSHEPAKGPLPELDFIKDSRVVGLLFDANAGTNKMVRAGRNALAQQLKSQGAKVQIIGLPALPDVNGPDDFIGAQGDQAFLDLLNSPPKAETKPTIVCHAGRIPEVADDVEQVLVEHAEELRIFERSGQIVRVVTLRQPQVSAGLRRPAGTIVIEPLDKYQLLESFERLCQFQKATDDGLQTIDCPSKVAEYYLRRTGGRALPVLVGTIFTPYLRDDGTVVGCTGYDQTTGLYLVSEETWLPVPERPTKDDAFESLYVLMAPFQEFQFCGDVDRSVLLAALLTGIQRRLLPTAPLFLTSAPKQREGKSLLGDAVAITQTGRTAPCQVMSRDDEEFRKTIFSTLLEGHACVSLDNLERPLKSSHLCTALTQETFSDRILGSSQTFHLSTRTLWLGNGCNVTVKGDLCVRTLICRLDSKTERPEERCFRIPDVVEYLKAHRPELVQAALTILRAHYLHRDETPKITPWGGYDRWSQAIRGPIAWLGLQDPAETRNETIANDPEQDTAIVLLNGLSEAYPSGSFLMREALEKAFSNSKLADALHAVADRKGQIDHRALGWWFRQWKDRITGGLCLREADKEHGAVLWKIEKMEGQENV